MPDNRDYGAHGEIRRRLGAGWADAGGLDFMPGSLGGPESRKDRLGVGVPIWAVWLRALGESHLNPDAP